MRYAGVNRTWAVAWSVMLGTGAELEAPLEAARLTRRLAAIVMVQPPPFGSTYDDATAAGRTGRRGSLVTVILLASSGLFPSELQASFRLCRGMYR